jgi:hypothetical protein
VTEDSNPFAEETNCAASYVPMAATGEFSLKRKHAWYDSLVDPYHNGASVMNVLLCIAGKETNRARH